MEQVQFVTEDDIIFKLKSDGTADLYLGTRNDSGFLSIPAQCQGYQVVRICERAFAQNRYLSKVIIPWGVTEIQNAAFSYCKNLSEVIIPDSVVKMGMGVFDYSSHREKATKVQVVEGSYPHTFCQAHGIPYSFANDLDIRKDIFQGVKKEGRMPPATMVGPSSAPENYFPPSAGIRDQLKKQTPKEPTAFPMDLVGMRLVSGKVLAERGFSFFREDRRYQMDAPDQNGIVRVFSKYREVGPDEDGYGAMEYFDWWMMDTNLEPIPGVKVFYGYSPPDLFGTNTKKKWEEQYAKAVETLKQRK